MYDLASRLVAEELRTDRKKSCYILVEIIGN